MLFTVDMFRYIGRIPSASVATGNKAHHKTEQESVRTTTFSNLWDQLYIYIILLLSLILCIT